MIVPRTTRNPSGNVALRILRGNKKRAEFCWNRLKRVQDQYNLAWFKIQNQLAQPDIDSHAAYMNRLLGLGRHNKSWIRKFWDQHKIAIISGAVFGTIIYWAMYYFNHN